VLLTFQVTVHPVGGVEVVPPVGCDTRTSVLFPVKVVDEKPPLTAFGWRAGQVTEPVVPVTVFVTTT
jgi:hypothetical protein